MGIVHSASKILKVFCLFLEKNGISDTKSV